MSGAHRRAHAATFGSAAAAYERGRPGYPAEALDWLLPAGASVVVDLGAGTGKLTRQLLVRGLTVLAVEPSLPMLAQLEKTSPAAQARQGSAEDTGLPDASVDVVLMAQAWHWVDPEPAVAELARILRPGGTLGLVWNLRTGETEAGRALEGLLGGSDGEAGWDHTDPSAVTGSPFGPGEEHEVRWTQRLSGDQLVDLVASRSYVIAMRPEQRGRLLGEVSDLVAGATGPVELSYRTWCLRYRLSSS